MNKQTLITQYKTGDENRYEVVVKEITTIEPREKTKTEIIITDHVYGQVMQFFGKKDLIDLAKELLNILE